MVNDKQHPEDTPSESPAAWQPPPPGLRPESGEARHEVPTEKVCPACAETVRHEAFVCRVCRYDWRTETFVDARPAVNGLAVASLTLALVALMIFPLVPLSALGGVLAVVSGAVARRQIKRRPGWSGQEMARFGVLLGSTAVAVAIALAVAALAFDVAAVTVTISGL